MTTPLCNPRHEHFAQLVAGGESATKAYVSSGYSEKGAAQSANRLLKTAKVQARVRELQEAVAERGVEKAAVDRAWVLGHLTENVRRAMQETPVRDSKGNELGTYEYAGAVANRALELLGKELGMFRERLELEGQVDIAAAIIAGRQRVEAYRREVEPAPAERPALPAAEGGAEVERCNRLAPELPMPPAAVAPQVPDAVVPKPTEGPVSADQFALEVLRRPSESGGDGSPK